MKFLDLDGLGTFLNKVKELIAIKQDKLTAGTNITIDSNNVISASGSGGTSDYTDLTNKPSINSVTLSGNKTSSDLSLLGISDLGNIPHLDISDFEGINNVEQYKGHIVYIETLTSLDLTPHQINELFWIPTDASMVPRFELQGIEIRESSDGKPCKSLLYCEGRGHLWTISTTSLMAGTTTVTSSSTDNEYPTAKLLYDQLQLKQDEFITFFAEDLLLVDGTATTLATGYYYTGNYNIKVNGTTNSVFDDTLIFVDNSWQTAEYINIFAIKDNGHVYFINYSDYDGEQNYVYSYNTGTFLDQTKIKTTLPPTDSSIYDRFVPSARLLRSQLLLKQDKLTAGTNITIDANNVISATGGGGGTSDYTDLTNKPSINNVTLAGNKTSADLGLPSITYGTTDLTPGVSSLAEGAFYFMYE